MKRWFFFAFAILTLVGVGAYLIYTRQSSDIIPPVVDSSQGGATSVSSNPRLQHMTIDEFRVLGQEVTKSLPTKDEMKNLSAEESHFTPGPLLLAGERLGQIAEAVTNEPSLGSEGMAFYLDCANSTIYPDSIRALCLSNYQTLGKKQNLPLQDRAVSEEIRRLAEKLQGI